MSRALLFGFFVAQLFCLTSWAAPEKDTETAAAEINLQEPPFWMPSIDEYKDWQTVQKEFYLKNVAIALKQIPGMEKVSRNSLEEASDWYKSWDAIRRKLYTACLKDNLSKACDAVADVRIQALENFSIKKNAEARP